jgi:hypothetical protein
MKTIMKYCIIMMLTIFVTYAAEAQPPDSGFVGPIDPYAVSGPSSETSTDNAVPRWDGVDGKTLQDSTLIVDDLGNASGLGKLSIAAITAVAGSNKLSTTGSSTAVTLPAADYSLVHIGAVLTANSVSRTVIAKPGSPVVTVDTAVDWQGTTGYTYTYANPIFRATNSADTAGFSVSGGASKLIHRLNATDYWTADITATRGVTFTSFSSSDPEFIFSGGTLYCDDIHANQALEVGQDGTEGYLSLYSEQGATDYTARIYTNPAMTSNARFYLPPDEPAGTYILNMATDGKMGFDSSTYVKPENAYSFTFAPAAGASGNVHSYTSVLNEMNGGDEVNILNIALTNANHTGLGNTLSALNAQNITGDADAIESVLKVGTGWDYILYSANAKLDNIGNFILGGDGYTGSIKMVSEQGATDYDVTLKPNAAMTDRATFYFPADEPAGTYLLNMTSGGVMGYDTSVYLTAEADTLATVTGRGATTTQSITTGPVFTSKFDAAAYWTATQADEGGATFDSVSDGTPGFTFLDPIYLPDGLEMSVSMGPGGVALATFYRTGVALATVEETRKPTTFPWQPPCRIFVYDGTAYTDLDITRYKPAVTKSYYVDVATGDNGAAGTEAAPLKSIKTALAKADVDAVYVAPGLYQWGDGWDYTSVTRSISVQRWGDSGEVRISASVPHASLVWAAEAAPNEDVWAAAWATETMDEVFDAANLDVYGDYTLLTERASVAEVQANAGSFWVNAGVVYVRTVDSRTPDTDIYVTVLSRNIRHTSAVTLYLANITAEFGQGTLYAVNASASLNLYAYNCVFGYSTTQDMVYLSGGGQAIFEECVFKKSIGDCYKNIANTTQAEVLLVNCEARTAGRSGTAYNAYSSHDGATEVYVGCVGYNTYGPVINNIGVANTWMVGCYMHDSIAAGATNYNYGVTGNMWLDTCVSSDSTYDLVPAAASTIYTYDLTSGGSNSGAGTVSAYTALNEVPVGYYNTWPDAQTFDGAISSGAITTTGLFTHKFDTEAYWTATQANGAGVTFDSVSDGVASFTFSDRVVMGKQELTIADSGDGNPATDRKSVV